MCARQLPDHAGRVSRRGPIRRWVGALVLTLAALSAPAALAHAADGPLQLSTDGVAFTRTLSGSLFDPDFRIVPTDSVTRDVWVRNSGAQAGRLRFDLLNADASDPVFAANLTLSVTDADGSGTSAPSTIADAATCQVLHHGATVGAGEVAHLTVRAQLGNLTGAQGQRARAAFGFRAVLTDASAPPPADPSSCTLADGDDDVEIPGTDDGGDGDDGSGGGDESGGGDGDGGDDLARTGAGRVTQAAAIGSGLLLVGGLLVALAGRRGPNTETRDSREETP